MHSNQPTLDRRRFLRASGVALSLPTLHSLGAAASTKKEAAPPKRFVGICETLGFHADYFFPTTAGSGYESSRYLSVLEDLRDDYSVFSGLSHHGVNGGHAAEKSFLSAAPGPKDSSFTNTISLDQVVAEAVGRETRLRSLNLRTASDRGSGMSVNRYGQLMPVLEDGRQVFAKMFFSGRKADKDKIIAELRNDRSLIDQVHGEARSILGKVDAHDRDRLDEYFTALRKVERELHRNESWEKTPKPKVDYELPARHPSPTDIVGMSRLLLDLSALAFRTDSTRSIALKIFGSGARPTVPGVDQSHHGLSHHGLDDEKIRQLALVELAVMETFRDFLDELKHATESDGSRLLDQTVVLLGSNMGNASSHSTKNLPILVAGGGFQHGKHHAFDPSSSPPLANLYVDILQEIGIETDRFASSTGTLPGFVV